MDYSKYKNTFFYPNRVDYYTYNVFNKDGKCELFTVKFNEIREWFKSENDTETNIRKVLFERGYAIARIDNDDKYQEQKKLYYDEESRLYELFKKDLYEEYDVANLKNVDKVFEKAWEYGHSSGYNEVALHFSNLIDIIKD